MDGGLVARYEALHRLLGEIAEASSDACSEREVAELAISHERAVRRLGSIGLRRILDVSDRDAHTSVQSPTLTHFVAERLRVPNPKRRLKQVLALSEMFSVTGEKLPAKCPETAAAMADGDLTHEHVDAVLGVMDKVPAATPPEVREKAEEQMAEIARHHSPKDIHRAGARLLAHIDPDGAEPSDRDRARQRSLSLGNQDPQLMSKLRGNLDPVTRALFEVVLAKWAKPGMNNPDDEASPQGGVDDDGIDTDAVKAAADRDSRTQQQRNHDALQALLRAAADGGLMGKSHRGLPPHLIISITETQLRERAGIGHTATGTDLPMSDIITLAAQAQMHLAVFDDITGEALFYGRSRRLASEAQRFVAFAQYGGCSMPGCPAPFSHTEAHHAEQDWAHGGTTDITDLAPACGPHNRAVHDRPGGWQTRKIIEGPDRGKFGWTANGTTDPPRTNHLHRPDQLLADHAPPDPHWSDIEHRLERILAEHNSAEAGSPPEAEPWIIRVIDYRSVTNRG
ncbi:HNH endonuclease signature motif containing protein [Williamsia deligens]|uniref:DUF222 domain-containing protein n=1 Tax=Williamsia deligens TaxID=321325 RepID=A0ABW3GDC2_9NOCA|nr:HNH endonuclease signature motif containing protein [Williamsia deligens]MCP2192324.1 protein of unknown function (DUF222) [Williamsia deligens]